MKKNFPVSTVEHPFPEGANIVSTTDQKGILTYANQHFVDISGFSKDELYGKNHNIVRHPDMPEAAFVNLWETIKAGSAWMGIVKNRCKNGDYYWVDAYVTPLYENGQLIGYQSVRSKPEKNHVKRADSLYKSIAAGKKNLKHWFSLFGKSLQQKLFATQIMAALVTILSLSLMQGSVNGFAVIAVLLGTCIAMTGSALIARPWKKAAERSKAIFDNPIAREVYTGRQDELGQLELAIHALELKIQTILVRVDDATQNLDQSIEQTQKVAQQNFENSRYQVNNVQNVTNSIEQLLLTISEITQNANLTLEQSADADQASNEGVLTSTEALGGMDKLVADIEKATQVINHLKEQSDEIGSVIDVIHAIAEQTNLLALNAAIEAARAGEQGRGFAVVADEVRNLANRTQQSTGEIQTIVEKLQQQAEDAARQMENAGEQANTGAELVESSAESLAMIAGAIRSIKDLNTQIAAALEEQDSATTEIKGNIDDINQLAGTTIDTCQAAQQSFTNLHNERRALKEMVSQFNKT